MNSNTTHTRPHTSSDFDALREIVSFLRAAQPPPLSSSLSASPSPSPSLSSSPSPSLTPATKHRHARRTHARPASPLTPLNPLNPSLNPPNPPNPSLNPPLNPSLNPLHPLYSPPNTAASHSSHRAQPLSTLTPSSHANTHRYQSYTQSSLRALSPVLAGSSRTNPPLIHLRARSQQSRRPQQVFELDPVIFMLKSTHHYMQKQAVSILYSLCFAEENHINIADKGVIPLLLPLASACDPEIQKEAANTIALLTSNEHILDKIADSNGVPVLLQLLNEFDFTIRSLVLKGLLTMASKDSNAVKIVESGGVDVIVHIARGKFLELRRLASEIFKQLSEYKEVCAIMSTKTVMQDFGALLKSKDVVVRIHTLEALSTFLKHAPSTYIPQAFHHALHSSVMDTVRGSSKDDSHHTLFLAGLSTLSELSHEANCTTYFLEHNIYEILVDGLKSKNLDVQKEVLHVFSSICTHDSFCAVLMEDHKTMVSILNLGYSTCPAVKKSVAKTIRRVSTSNYSKALLGLDVASCLIGLAKFPDNEIRVDTALSLGNLLIFDSVPVEERVLDYQKLVRIGLIEAIYSLCETEHREARCSLSNILAHMCDYIQDFEKNTPLLLTAIGKLFFTPEKFIVSNLTHVIYSIAQVGTHNRNMVEAGLLIHLRKYATTRDLEQTVQDEASKSIELLSKESYIDMRANGGERHRIQSFFNRTQPSF